MNILMSRLVPTEANNKLRAKRKENFAIASKTKKGSCEGRGVQKIKSNRGTVFVRNKSRI